MSLPHTRSRRSPPFKLVALIATGLAAPSALAELAAGLALDLKEAIRTGRPAGASLGVSIRDLASGDEIFRLDGDRPLMPASNMKVLTTGAALVTLGADFRFRSRMLLVDRGGAAPDLYLLGDGDPAIADPELLSFVTWTRPDGSVRQGLDADGFLGAWTDAIVKTDVHSLDSLVIDDRVFDRVTFHPQWPRDQFPEQYCSEVHGFNFHHNVVRIWPSPKATGRAAIARMSPDLPFLPIENRTTSNRAASAKHTFWVGRPADGNALTLNGNVQVEPRDPVTLTLHDTPSLLGELLGRRLRAAGVGVGGTRVANESDPRGTGRPIGPLIETPLATVLRRCNTDSDNLSAECLLKRLVHERTGRPGSWDDAATVLPEILARRLGDPSAIDGLVVSDGSGLSRMNRVTASLMTRWIAAIATDPATSAAFRESLAVGGETGTVKNRFQSLAKSRCTVLCKTGYIRGVCCLSGIVLAPDGRGIAFSVLGNELNAKNAIGDTKALQERIVREIAEDLERPRTALGG